MNTPLFNKLYQLAFKLVCLYITSLDLSAKELLRISREHWKIESLHWMLDVVFDEDGCEIISKNGHIALNAFRKLALLLHRQYVKAKAKKCSVRTSLLNCLLGIL